MTAEEVMQLVSNGLWLGVSLAAVWLWWRTRAASATWLLATFAAFDFIILMDIAGVGDRGAIERLIVVVLLGSPYLLFRFADTIVAAGRRLHGVLSGLLVLLAAWTLLQGPPAEPFEGLEVLYVVIAVVAWLVPLGAAAALLARASGGQPGVVRTRLRLLAAAAALLGLIIPLGLVEELRVVSQGISPLAAVLFLVGFAPPTILRAAWRHDEERQLYAAAVDFLSAERPDQVAAVLAPRLRALLGASYVRLYGRGGAMLAADEAPRRDLREGEVVVRELGSRRLEVSLSPGMPLFGRDEEELLDRLAVLAELAFERTRLMQAERDARDDLERVNAELESFVYTTSHDLKNPVIALLGYLEVIEEDHLDEFSGPLRHYLQRMHANAKHMEALLRDLLELSRVGRVDVEPADVDLVELLTDIVDGLRHEYPRLELRYAALPALWVNPTRARQLFTNLLENAAKYGDRDDVTVEVEAVQDGTDWTITVADDGRGIPPEHRERVFGVFERLDTSDRGGTGMGLAICRRIVETFGGEIALADSEQGARFLIRLPSGAVRPRKDAAREEVPL